MINRCRNCDIVLRDGDAVRVVVESEYKELKSRVSFAISKGISHAYADTLEHVACRQPREGTA